MTVYRDFLKQLNKLKTYDPVAASTIKFNTRTDLELSAFKYDSQLRTSLTKHNSNLELIKRATSGDMNALDRVIRTLGKFLLNSNAFNK